MTIWEWITAQNTGALLSLVIFGFPAIFGWMVVAIIGVYRKKSYLLVVAAIMLLPVCLYLLGANNWIRVLGLLIPVSLLFAAFLIEERRAACAKPLLLVPIGSFTCLFVWISLH